MDPQPSPYIQEPAEPKTSLGAHVIDFIQTLVVFAAIGTVIYLFIAQPHKVSGASMFPNFKDGDYIITDKVSYKFTAPRYGDVVVFKNPQDESQDFIKRIIGIPGDKVRLENGTIFVNNKALGESYLGPGIVTPSGAFLKESEEVTVPEGKYFVMGDNRNKSSDSREWGFITKDEILGKVFLRYWPKEAVGFYPAALK